MVREERISRKAPDEEVDPTGERFKLIEVFVQEPTANPNHEAKVSARPYEFENDLPSKYATSCPHCGQGIWFGRYDMHAAVDRFFIACPECGAGTIAVIEPMADPFVNPVDEKIAETVLDPDLSKAQDPITPDTRTVQEKLAGAGEEATDDDAEFLADYREALDIPVPEPSEIEQILEELEGKV